MRNADGQMVPIGALAELQPGPGPPLISLYNLYPSAAIVGSPARASAPARRIALMDEIANTHPAAGHGLRMDRDVLPGEHRRQPDLLYVFALAILLVYLCLAGQYESWIAPLAVILAVPLALIGPAVALSGVGLANNLYTQIGLMLLIALGAKNAILIVEVAREARMVDGKPIVEAAVEAARTRFRPILMTSFAFILGVVPLVTATGAGANARISLGLCRVQRHDRLDLPRRAVRAVVLHRAAALRGAGQDLQGSAEGSGRRHVAPDETLVAAPGPPWMLVQMDDCALA